MNIHKKFFSKIGANYLIYGVLALAFQFIVINITGNLNAEILSDYNMTVILVALCNYVLPLPIILLLMRKIDGIGIEKSTIKAQTFLKYICIALTLMWIGNIAGLAITYGLANLTQTPISNPVHDLINNSDIWLNLALVSIIGPIFEEFLFRKLLIDRSIKYGARVSIILSATLFAFFHGNLNQFFYAFLIGGFFAYVYIKTGKIIYTISLHIILNFMGSVVSLFVSSSITALTQGSYTSADLTIIAVYTSIILTALFFGVLNLLYIKKSKFNGAKTQIALTSPLKTMFLNYGMVLFMVFFVFEMIYQIMI